MSVWTISTSQIKKGKQRIRYLLPFATRIIVYPSPSYVFSSHKPVSSKDQSKLQSKVIYVPTILVELLESLQLHFAFCSSTLPPIQYQQTQPPSRSTQLSPSIVFSLYCVLPQFLFPITLSHPTSVFHSQLRDDIHRHHARRSTTMDSQQQQRLRIYTF